MKKAIFGTRDIYDTRPAHTGQAPTHEEIGRFGGRHSWYSTGKLEEALASGYEIYVISIRPAFGPHDDWWRALVPSENVYVNPGIMAAFMGDPTSSRVHGAWQNFYRRFGLPWSHTFRDLDDPRTAAVTLHGFTDGGSFYGRTILH